MTSLHGEMQDWLAAGADGPPARDQAVHAAFCPACLAAADGLDALRAVDIGGSETPSRLAIAAAPSRRLADLSYFGAAAASVLVVAAVLVIQAWPLIPDFPRIDVDPGRRVAEEVLSGGDAGPSADSTAGSPSDEAVASGSVSSPSEDPDSGGQPASVGGDPIGGQAGEPSPAAGGPQPLTPPPIGPEPTAQPSLPTPPTGTASPTADPTTPPTATPGPTPPPTAQPTAPPTAPPTPVPTPTPEPDPSSTGQAQCSDGIDNDGDGLFDTGVLGILGDPDCTGPDDDSEAF